MSHMGPPIQELGALLSSLYIKPRSFKESSVLKYGEGIYEVWEQHDTGRGQSTGSGKISFVDEIIVQEALKQGYLHEVTENEEPYKPSKSTWYVLTNNRVKLAEIIPTLEAWEEKVHSSQQDV